ncbi:MAG: HAMP domain-containing histidine kinase [Sandaracinaceae bacterium]|jgi:signal transduction histidine kinase|nr:HAMP domain-containing histidine kinase [Sandaracinaceae bacterium]
MRPRAPLGSEIFEVLPSLEAKSWLRALEVLEQPPTVFSVHGLTERCVELPVNGRLVWVRIAWEADLDGTRAELVDRSIELARLRAERRVAEHASEAQHRTERLARTSRIAFEMELRAARAIAADAMVRREDAERMTVDAERRRIARDQIVAASALFASVAHDIRSPLTALVLNLRILEEEARKAGQLSSPTQAMFDDTRLACDLIEGVLDGLRTYASCSGVARRLPLKPIVDCAVRLFRWHMQQKGVTLSVDVHGEPEAWGTTSEICQILLNLLANAAEASPRGSAVALECGVDAAGAWVRVDDDGPGLGDGDPERVFEPFRSSKEDGLGIGLTVARAMARRHGGDLVVVKSHRQGASFELRLPRTAR